MDVNIKYLNGRSELIEDVEVVKENSRMRLIDVTYKEREVRKILNFAAIESIEILEEK